jgi:hypothetical protein
MKESKPPKPFHRFFRGVPGVGITRCLILYPDNDIQKNFLVRNIDALVKGTTKAP